MPTGCLTRGFRLSLQWLGHQCLSLALWGALRIPRRNLPEMSPRITALLDSQPNKGQGTRPLRAHLTETQEAYVLRGQDQKANELLEPDMLQLRGDVLQGRRVLPHHLDVLAVWLPEGLLELQEDFIAGPKAYFPDRFCLLSGQWWFKEGVQVFFKKTCNSQADSAYTT